MAKRFTDTDIWDKEWFMKLSVKHKCLIRFLFDKCDASGVWSSNWILASSYIGEQVSEADIEVFEDRVLKISQGKFFVTDFIQFQYGKLSKDCKPHVPVYRLLDKHGIDLNDVKMSDAMGKSHNVHKSRRDMVLEQDGYTCCYCGKEKEPRNLVIDHVVSRKRGGTDGAENLVASCVPCNAKKSDFSLEEFCLRTGLDFSIISQRVSDRVSNRVSDTLKEKDKEKDMEKEEEIKGGTGEKETVYREFAHLSLSDEEFLKLCDLGYSVKEIDSILDAIQNYKKNKLYVSLFLTAKKWLEKERATPTTQGSKGAASVVGTFSQVKMRA